MTRWRGWASTVVVLCVLVGGCSTGPEPGCSGGSDNCGDSGRPASAGPTSDAGDPNAAGREIAAATAQDSAAASVLPALPGGSMGICANETLGESMARTVESGSTIVLATGGFTGRTTVADGEIGVPYSQVLLDVERVLAGAPVDESLSAWVYGDLAAPPAAAATTGETSSLWARGGRMIAIVDGTALLSGLDGPVIRVAPVVDDQVILSFVGCWPTSGVTTTEFDGTLDIFDERGLHPTGMHFAAATLANFEATLPR